MARNRYAGPCKDCGETVPEGAGYFEKQRGGGWKVRHVLCTAKGLVAKGASVNALSPPQRLALEAAISTDKQVGTDGEAGSAPKNPLQEGVKP